MNWRFNLIIIIINILIYHKCPTYSGELTLVNSERTVASAEDASVKLVWSVNTTFCFAENASGRTETLLDLPKLDEMLIFIVYLISNTPQIQLPSFRDQLEHLRDCKASTIAPINTLSYWVVIWDILQAIYITFTFILKLSNLLPIILCSLHITPITLYRF